MQTTQQHTTSGQVTGLLADLTAVTDRLLSAVTTTTADEVGMATAGSILASTDRLTAAVVAVLSQVTHRGVIADEDESVGPWLRTFAARTTSDEKLLAATVDRLADMPTVHAWFLAGELSWPVVRSIMLAVRTLTRAQRTWVDTALAADRDRVGRLDADQVVAAVDALANQARHAPPASTRSPTARCAVAVPSTGGSRRPSARRRTPGCGPSGSTGPRTCWRPRT